jgi:hypothetical protein
MRAQRPFIVLLAGSPLSLGSIGPGRAQVPVTDGLVIRGDTVLQPGTYPALLPLGRTIVLRCSCDADDADLHSLKVTAMRVNSYWNLSE